MHATRLSELAVAERRIHDLADHAKAQLDLYNKGEAYVGGIARLKEAVKQIADRTLDCLIVTEVRLRLEGKV